MAKKRTYAAPTRECVNPACEAVYHPMTKVCPVCQTPNPIHAEITARREEGKPPVKKKRPQRKKKAARVADQATAPVATRRKIPKQYARTELDALEAAIQFVESVGSVDRAQEVLARISALQ